MSSLPSRFSDLDVRMAALKANAGLEAAMTRFRELDYSTRLLGLAAVVPFIVRALSVSKLSIPLS